MPVGPGHALKDVDSATSDYRRALLVDALPERVEMGAPSPTGASALAGRELEEVAALDRAKLRSDQAQNLTACLAKARSINGIASRSG